MGQRWRAIDMHEYIIYLLQDSIYLQMSQTQLLKHDQKLSGGHHTHPQNTSYNLSYSFLTSRTPNVIVPKHIVETLSPLFPR